MSSSSSVRRHEPLHSSSKANQAGDVREVTRQGREYLVFPLIALREMVIDYPENGTRELLERERLHETAHLWAGTPLVYIHPENETGTAAVPESFVRENIGEVFEPEIVDDEKLKVQAWLDVQKARDIGGLAEQVVDRLKAGDRLSVSAGYTTFDDRFETGTHRGDEYDVKQGTIVPDHVAIFPSDEFQARCDWQDGCGAPRANYVSDCGCSHQQRENLGDVGSSEPADVEPDVEADAIEFSYDDWFLDEEPARDRASALGCDGVHTHQTSTGRTLFMPCSDHDEYVEVLRAQAESTPRSELGSGADRSNVAEQLARNRQSAMQDSTEPVDEDPATLFQRLLRSVGYDPDQAGEVQANTSAQTDATTDDAADDAAESEESDEETVEDGGEDSEESTDTDGGDTSDDEATDMDNDGETKENEMTLSVEDLAEHTMFSVETLEEMGDDMLEQLEQDVIRELIGSGSGEGEQPQQEQAPERQNADEESETEPSDSSDQEADTVTQNNQIDTEQFVTEEQLDDRLDSLEDTVTNAFEDTLDEKLEEVQSQKENARDEQHARIVANAIDGMSVEAAQELPSEELAELADKHGGPHANYAGVPGQVDRSFDESDGGEYEEYPAGGRSNWEQRAGGE